MLIEDISTLISIHAPLAGSDGADIVDINIARHISTHAPHAGSDFLPVVIFCIQGKFQPTLPMRGATPLANVVQHNH